MDFQDQNSAVLDWRWHGGTFFCDDFQRKEDHYQIESLTVSYREDCSPCAWSREQWTFLQGSRNMRRNGSSITRVWGLWMYNWRGQWIQSKVCEVACAAGKGSGIGGIFPTIIPWKDLLTLTTEFCREECHANLFPFWETNSSSKTREADHW